MGVKSVGRKYDEAMERLEDALVLYAQVARSGEADVKRQRKLAKRVLEARAEASHWAKKYVRVCEERQRERLQQGKREESYAIL